MPYVFYSGLLPHEHESYYLQCWEFLHPGFHILHCIGFSIGMTTWYLIYYHISFEEKPYSLLTPGQTIWTGLVGKATPSKTAKLSTREEKDKFGEKAQFEKKGKILKNAKIEKNAKNPDS